MNGFHQWNNGLLTDPKNGEQINLKKPSHAHTVLVPAAVGECKSNRDKDNQSYIFSNKASATFSSVVESYNI